MKTLDEKTAAQIKKTLEDKAVKEWMEANKVEFKMMDARQILRDIADGKK